MINLKNHLISHSKRPVQLSAQTVDLLLQLLRVRQNLKDQMFKERIWKELNPDQVGAAAPS